MDVAALRAEIKTWERDFRASHGRDPSIQEIKDQPAIAAKYKLYKSLSKASSSGSLLRPARLSTPPPPLPRQPPASSILPKPRAVKVDPPVTTSNPFSPVKNRKTFTDPAPSLQRVSNQSRSNPFATPSKPKNKPHVTRRSPSPDPFPPIQPLLLVERPPLSPAADTAVTRARKRLRGEPVSPSPVKEKRQRVTSQAALSFPSRAALLHSPDVSDGDEPTADPNDTIIADTPMKPRIAGRNFKVLFDDAHSNGEKRTVNGLSSRKTQSPAPILLGGKRASSRAFTPSSDEEDDWSLKPAFKKSLGASAAIPAKQAQSKSRTGFAKLGVPKALVPAKDNLWADAGPSNTSQSRAPSFSKSQPNSHMQSRPPNKRALADDHDDVHDNISHVEPNGYLNLPLIPPSPPPPDSSKQSGAKYADKGKAKAGPYGRKKAKVVAGDGALEAEDDSPEDEIQVREIDPASQPPKVERDVDPDSDWEAHWRSRPDSDDPVTLSASDQTGKFEVQLPDELQRILAISPGSRARDSEEERVVRSLLYGSRETHYDPSKGGEIWDIGEDSEHVAGTEDEWEGEPVPWEVGEL